ncbi:hypothetical protein [Campylobacter showae]|uniref:Uncharacterized protein n=1 Tax=Campylobacter showae RM3277 TaxID=553219 RepID=C6REU8_9BACT|nr:hypothetical protein [Campylobacter showae]EET80079.1 hypothetical protein CAMSH0001_1681 [Campylobacter showae RM3277]
MSKKAFAFLALLLALCVAGSLLLGKYGFGAEDYARYVTALLRGESLKDFEVMHTLLLEIRLPRILACATTANASSHPSSPTCRRHTRRRMTTASLTSL